jgi:hypothetical protein
MQFKVIETDNPLAVHAICDTRERAQYWIDVKAPAYVAKGYFVNKALTPASFTIIEVQA